jgi:hypothetical protein
MEDNLIYIKKNLQKKEYLDIIKNGRRPQKIICMYNQLQSTAHTSRQPDQQNEPKVNWHNLKENQS